MSTLRLAASADDLSKSDSQSTLVDDMNRLNTEQGNSSESPSNHSVTITIPQLLERQKKRSAEDAEPSTSTADDSAPKPKRGRPNIPQALEGDYKALRNLRAKAARLEANYTMLKKYADHHEHIVPSLYKVRLHPPFGADDDGVKAEWRAIQREAEKSFLLCTMAHLKKLYKDAEKGANSRLTLMKAKLPNDKSAIGDLDNAATTVANRVRNLESLKLRQRWVYDMGKLEASKVGLPPPKRVRDNVKQSKKGGVPKSSAAADESKGKKTAKRSPTTAADKGTPTNVKTGRIQKKAKRQLKNTAGDKLKKAKFEEHAATLKAILSDFFESL